MKSRKYLQKILITILPVILLTAVTFGLIYFLPRYITKPEIKNADIVNSPSPQPTAPPTPTPIPTPSPTPKPLTFEEMNNFYGPCTYLPVIFYHHIQDLNEAKSQGHQSLAVDPGIFSSQMQYLKDKGYNTVTMTDLNNFFDSGTAIAHNSILLTFDDGYNDFDSNAMPVIRNLSLHATMFLPTGLVGNPGYLTWDQVMGESGSGLVYFANHSWSHANLANTLSITQKEVDTSQDQLVQHGLNPNMVLAYPYGTVANFTVDFLQQKGFKLAFTTEPGNILCKTRRLSLPRIRIGNAPLSAYGF